MYHRKCKIKNFKSKNRSCRNSVGSSMVEFLLDLMSNRKKCNINICIGYFYRPIRSCINICQYLVLPLGHVDAISESILTKESQICENCCDINLLVTETQHFWCICGNRTVHCQIHLLVHLVVDKEVAKIVFSN